MNLRLKVIMRAPVWTPDPETPDWLRRNGYHHDKFVALPKHKEPVAA
ncbi:hypothetical protein ACFXNW_09050 [Nocardia sp. NPDC059180]